MSVNMHRVGDVAFVTLDNPPVNAIGLSVRSGLMRAIEWVATEQNLSHVVLSGVGKCFAAGADATEFDAPPKAPHLPDVVAGIEQSDVPWVAAINGLALGGGAELTLACNYRVISPNTKIGFPEVTLGVVPGAGGTQRLPRLIGVAAAIDMIATGRPVSAAKGLSIGLVDVLSEDPVEAATKIEKSTLVGIRLAANNPSAQLDEDALKQGRAMVAKKFANQIAPAKAIDLIEISCSKALAYGLAQEREAFLTFRSGPQSKALRHVFFAERGARAPKQLKSLAVALDHVAVVGGGTMGAGIAYALLNAGLKVTVLETDSEAAVRARDNVEKIIKASQARGLISDRDAADRRTNLETTSDYSSAADATLAIEAAFESMEVKKAIFEALQANLPPDAILATNTSYLDVDEIAANLDDPSRLLGLHFFAPAHIMKLLEIVKGAKTGQMALATGYALATRLGKIPVVAGVCDGFIGNRILARYREAADTVFMDGSTPWEIDDAMVEFGYAMGPYEAQDLSGLDIAHANRRRQDATRDPKRRYVPIADRMIELGKLGRKTSAGWYRYPGGGSKVEDPIVADLALEEAHFAGLTRTDYTADQIRERLLMAMINEAADILFEGIAASASDIDLVTVHGYGFPRWRGGLMHYADSLGVDLIVQTLDQLAIEDPIVWRASPVLRDCQERGISLADWRREA